MSRIVGGMAAAVVVLPLVVAPAMTAAAEEPGFVKLTKTASTETVIPGQVFTYTLEIGCTSFGAGCTGATLTDVIPAGLQIVGTPQIGTGLTGVPTVDGQNVTVAFTSPLSDPPGSVGLLTAATGTVTVSVRLDPNLPYSANGVAIDNTATLDATNAVEPATSTATVTPVVALELTPTATKTITPDGGLAVPGAAVTATLGATNGSNAAVDSLTISDPADPSAQPSPFEHLAFTGFGDVTFPDGADQVLVEVWDGTQWVVGDAAATPSLPDEITAEDVQGVRLTFTSSTGGKVAQGGAGGIVLELAQRDNTAGLTDPLTVTNTITSGVALGEDSETSAPASDTYAIVPINLSAAAGKTFSPDQVVAGQPSTVTLTGTNTGTTVESLVITEPDPASLDNPFENGLTFTGLGTDGAGAGIVWPTGAAAATVTYSYADGSSETLTASGPNTLPQPPPGKTVVGFTAEFTGGIISGGEATIPVLVGTDPDQDVEELAHDNTVLVTVRDGVGAGSATAEDTLTTFTERLAVTIDKQISPAQIPSSPGETAMIQLPAQLAPFPESTTKATHIVVQDPRVVPAVPSPDPWWNSFDARGISQTGIPAGSTLTVRYWDGTQWVVLPGAENLAGPQVVNIPIPAGLRDTIQGLQFDFADPEGFPPGTSVRPNFSTQLRADKRDGSGPAAGPADVIENCASTSATNGTENATAETAQPCPTIELIPVDPGAADLIEKDFLEPQPGASGKTVTARSGERINAQLSWSTGGFSGLDEMVLSDVADPATTPIADSVFDAFDLVAIPAITAAQDPLLTYDAIARVELWNGSAWAVAANDPCPQACDGTFPGLTFTDAEQDSTTGMRLVVVESPTRASRIGTDPTRPQVGDGVARSVGKDRKVRLTFQVRDETRSQVSSPDPVLGTRGYNLDNAPGDVLNTARATGFTDGSQRVTDSDSDVVSIIDVPLNVDVTKAWSGGPLGIPPAGTAADAYPSGRVRVDATNVTAAKVDSLTITEPATDDPEDDPFDDFDVKGVATISVPPGATDTRVTLLHADGSTTEHSRQAVLDMTSTDLADVVGITVTHTGRIDPGATAILTFDARLRPTDRETGEPVTTLDSPVTNRARASVDDLGGTPEDAPTADDDASIVLALQGISVTVTKAFSQPQIVEPSVGPVTMTLTGKPGGTSRTNLMTITDDDPQFWNQYDLVGFSGTFNLTAPITRVQVDAFVGGTLSAGPDGVEVTGGEWRTGEPTTAAEISLPDGALPADIQGLRFTFSRADGSIWENPANPTQSVPLLVQRRTELRTGGPVLSDMAGHEPAPGETQAGVATNTVDGLVQGAVLVGGQPITASDDDEESILYRHARNAVRVVKQAGGSAAGGAQAPDRVFPYTLEVTNTGDVPIVDPVIVDHAPSDAGGTQLVFDPTRAGGVGAFSYALSGATPAQSSGLALPSDPSGVTAVVEGNLERLSFSFPEGTVLEVGQTYTITIQVMFRPGLSGDTMVENTFGVVGERPWDECSGRLDPSTGECLAATTVDVVKAGALRTVKTVKAVDDELGVTSSVPGTVCAPDADDFYAYPCVPITKPGGSEVWRLHYTNTGNLPMSQVVAVDKLPAPGDTGVVNPLPRGSQWWPLLEGTVSLVDAPPGADLVTSWTTSTQPCVPSSTTPACSAVVWTPFPEDGGPALTPEQLESVTAVKFAIAFPDGELFAPLDEFSIDVTTTTPPFSPTAGPNTIAWNSVAAEATTMDGQVRGSVPATEGNKVGIALATGPISVVKEVTGDGADYAPKTFPVQVVCTSAVGTRVEAEVPLGDAANLTLVEGEPQTIADLPWGAECTVTEDDDATKPTAFEATTVTVTGDDQDIPVIVATNRYDLASLVLTKTVDSAAVDAAGDPVAYGPFTVEVSCTFLDEPVYAEGYGPDSPMVVDVAVGEPVELTGLPARAECTVTETDTMDATGTSVTVTQGDEPAVTTVGTAAPLTLLADSDEGATNDVRVTNTYAVGSVHVTKVIDGPGAEAYGAGPFTVLVVCALDDASGSRVVWDGTVSLGGDGPWDATIPDVAAGASCAVTEPDAGGATSTVISPEQVATSGDGIAEVTVTNTFGLGSLAVTKELAGAGAELYGTGPFETTLECTFNGAAIEILGGPTRAFTPEAPGLYENLPIGAECILAESLTGGATSSTVTGGEVEEGDEAGAADAGDAADASAVLITAGDPVARTITNQFDVGEVRIVKRLSGSGAAAHEGDTFVFQLVCTRDVDGTSVPVEIPGGAERPVSAADGWVAVFTDIPVGAECQVGEITSGDADVIELIVDGESTETVPGEQGDEDAEGAEVTSPSFVLPPGDDVCHPIEAINTWTMEGGDGRPTTSPTSSATPTGTPTASTPEGQLALDAGCDPGTEAPGGGTETPGGGSGNGSGDGGSGSDLPDADGPGGPGSLPWTGSNPVPLALIAALLVAVGYVVTRRRREP